MKKILIIDGNWYLHRVWFTMRTTRDLHEALPYSFLSLVFKDACLLKTDRILIAFDGDKVFRKSIYPEYKANRDDPSDGTYVPSEKGGGDTFIKDKKEVYIYLSSLYALLNKLGIPWVQNAKYEADDVLASCADQYSPYVTVVLGAKDKDLYQVLGPKVTMFDSTHKPEPKVLDFKYAEKRKGVPISKMVDYQTLLGDKTDNIPALLTEAKVRNVLSSYTSITDWYKKGSKEDKKWLVKNQPQIIINKKLVKMSRDVPLPELAELIIPKYTASSKLSLPSPWYAYQSFIYPKSKGLF